LPVVEFNYQLKVYIFNFNEQLNLIFN